MSYLNAKPIKWEPYKKEEVIVNINIRKGKKHFEREWYIDKAHVVPRGNAYIIGNGPSRKGFNLNKLPATGQTYGCNAIYRDFVPDFIFSVDMKMTLEMYEEEVYKKCIHYAPGLEVNRYPTKRCGLNNSDLHLIPNNPHWISGGVAMWTATVHGHKDLYFLGFDFREYGKEKLNNIYQDSKNYGPRTNDTIFEAWLTQFRSLQIMRPNCSFTVVHDDPPDYLQVCNPAFEDGSGRFKIITYKEFNDTVVNQAS